MKEWKQDAYTPCAVCEYVGNPRPLAAGFRVFSAVIAMFVATAWAMPTKDELKQVQPLVSELMSVHLKGYDAKKETAKEVGDAAAGFSKEAEGEAAKYLFLKGAIYYYALSKEYDKAADALESLRASVKDIPEEEVASLASKALVRAGRDEAQRLRTLYRVASMRAAAEADVKSFKTALRKDREDRVALRGLADAYVRLGDWPRVLKIFYRLGIRAAEFELNPEGTKDFSVLKAADYWWEFKAKDTNPYRIHAAVLYRTALAADLAKGLMKSLVEKRIAEADAFGVMGDTGSVTCSQTAVLPSKLYCIVDLSAGPNADKYPVSYRSTKPYSSWTDEYKTTKLVLRRIEPGTFIMGEDQKNEAHRITLTKPFYIGVFEVTQKQYALVTGGNPSKHKGDMRPVDGVSYNMIRGKGEGTKWPESSAVDAASFMGKLRTRTGLDFDLPTEAQWEYACRAGTNSLYNNGGGTEDDLKKLGRFKLNQKDRGWKDSKADLARRRPDGKGGHLMHQTDVGLYQPNAWGLYDMHGNVHEWCLDWYSRNNALSGTDPVGVSSGSKRCYRGGSWYDGADYCTSSRRYDGWSPLRGSFCLGFRLALRLE